MSVVTTISSFPHVEQNVRDVSGATTRITTPMPLHQPIFMYRAERGKPFEPRWFTGVSESRAVHGVSTFEKLSRYYSREAAFINTVSTQGGFWGVRMLDPAASTAMLIVSLEVEATDIVQYQKDTLGNRILDAEGAYVPITENDVPVTAPGYRIKWVQRWALVAGEEDLAHIVPTTVGDVTTYPMFACEATSAGAYGNDNGISIWYDPDVNLSNVVKRCGSVFYNFGASEIKYSNTTATPITNAFMGTFVTASFKSNLTDPSLKVQVGLDYKVEKSYTEDYPLPYSITIFEDNWKIVGDLCMAKETNIDENITDGWQMNLVSARNLNNKLYDCIVLDETSTVKLIKGNTYYLKNGTDGDISDTKIEELTRNFLDLTYNKDILDMSRYSFNHYYDTGVSMDTKFKMIDFMASREDAHVYVSPQDMNEALCDAETELSIANVLSARALMVRESIIFNTGACRTTIIYGSSKLLNTANYSGYLPATIEMAYKNARVDGTQTMGPSLKGEENSPLEVLDFKKFKWIPGPDALKQILWDAGGNYIEYMENSVCHFPDVRTVYVDQTSVLNSDQYVKAICYLKQAGRRCHMALSGVELPFADYKTQMERVCGIRMGTVIGSKYGLEINVYRTAEEADYGFIYHVEVGLTGYGPARVTRFDYVSKKETV